MSFHENLPDNDVFKVKVNNFVICLTDYNLKALNSTINHMEEAITGVSSGEKEPAAGSLSIDKLQSEKTKQSVVGHSEIVSDIRQQGGTILCLVDSPEDDKTDQLRNMIQEKSKELKEKEVCLNAVICQVCALCDTANMST